MEPNTIDIAQSNPPGSGARRGSRRLAALDHHSRSPRFLFNIFLGLIFWVPIPLGSNRPWAWSLMEVWIFGIAIVWCALYPFAKTAITPAFKKAIPVIFCWSLWILIGSLQFIPIPLEWAALLNPKITEIYLDSAIWGSLSTIPLSIVPYTSHVEWLKGFSYLLFFCLTLLLVESRQRLRILGWLMVSSALFQALIGIFLLISKQQTWLAYLYPSTDNFATGTFVNRNHFANFLVLNIAVGTGLLIAGLRSNTTPTHFKRWLLTFFKQLFSYRAPLRIFLASVVIGVILSRSRMGNISLLVSLTVAGMFAIYSFKGNRRTMALLLASFLLIDLFLIGTWVGIEHVVKRIENTELHQEGRLAVYKDTAVLIKDHWLTGAGTGSFSNLFPRYRSFYSDVNFRRAENDYLEILSEAGFIGFVLLGLPVLLSLFMAIRVQLQSKDQLLRGFSFASVMGITAMLLHAMSDFNLHIPANSAIFMILLAFPWILQVGREETAARAGRGREQRV